VSTDRQGASSPVAPGEDFVVPSVPQSVALIRRYALNACAGRPGDCDTLALLVSEVATNALVHGTGEVRVRVLTAGPRVRVEVDDDSTAVPVPRAPSLDAEGGRGLALVDALSADWGVDSRDGGKTVWFEVD